MFLRSIEEAKRIQPYLKSFTQLLGKHVAISLFKAKSFLSKFDIIRVYLPLSFIEP